MTTFLSDDVITLRAVEPDDIDLLMEWENDSSEWLSSANIAPYSRKQMWAYIDNYSADIAVDGQLRLMIVENVGRAIVGMVDLFDYDPINRRASVGIFVCRSARGHGIARHALDTIGRYASGRLMLAQLVVTISADNEASLALFGSVGYAEAGRLRQWYVRPCSVGGYVDAIICQKIFAGRNCS